MQRIAKELNLPADLKLHAWILDESEAFRQVPILPDHRRFAVIVVRHPDGRIGFFIMIGHSFGLISAVYNYNRRSAIINDILKKAFLVASTFYYDDKFGIETEEAIRTAEEAAVALHTLAGCEFSDNKRYLGRSPTILGVNYNLEKMHMEIEPDRKKELTAILHEIRSSNWLPPGDAAKIKGKQRFLSRSVCSKFLPGGNLW